MSHSTSRVKTRMQRIGSSICGYVANSSSASVVVILLPPFCLLEGKANIAGFGSLGLMCFQGFFPSDFPTSIKSSKQPRPIFRIPQPQLSRELLLPKKQSSTASLLVFSSLVMPFQQPAYTVVIVQYTSQSPVLSLSLTDLLKLKFLAGALPLPWPTCPLVF